VGKPFQKQALIETVLRWLPDARLAAGQTQEAPAEAADSEAMERLPLLEPPVFDDLAGLLGRDRALGDGQDGRGAAAQAV
jgi:hypothetical protein